MFYANGTSLKSREASLFFGFYYIRHRGRIGFDLFFDVRPSAKPMKLVYRGDVDLEVSKDIRSSKLCIHIEPAPVARHINSIENSCLNKAYMPTLYRYSVAV